MPDEIPDIEKLVASFLRDGDLRVVAEPPPEGLTDEAWVQIGLLDAPASAVPADYLIRATVQLDCYAGKDGGHPEATALAARTRARLHDLVGKHSLATVNAVDITGHSRVPDPDYNPGPRQRIVITSDITFHP